MKRWLSALGYFAAGASFGAIMVGLSLKPREVVKPPQAPELSASQSTSAEDEGFRSMAITNVSGFRIVEQTYMVEVESPIFDLAFAGYSQSFAKKYGYDPKYTLPLQEGLHAVTLQIRTEANTNRCYLGLFLDKDLPLNDPPRVFNGEVTLGVYGLVTPMPPITDKSAIRKPDVQKYNTEVGGRFGPLSLSKYVLNNYFKEPRDNRMTGRGHLETFYPYYFENLNFYRFSIGCSGDGFPFFRSNGWHTYFNKEGADISRQNPFEPVDGKYRVDIPGEFFAQVLKVPVLPKDLAFRNMIRARSYHPEANMPGENSE